ncbi:uncharacterized protein M6B38_374930 [Iris pallida]|uniref:Uncharacterized protein n=1 Tax=Iris pallida TaxID=29817 RepID=A0AAX6GB50_IRIPA|nr:uncharacterized protein M6B38_374930 [Iris pallida]
MFETGGSRSSTSLSTESFQRTRRKPSQSGDALFDSTTIQQLKRCTDAPLMGSSFDACPTKKQPKLFEKLMTELAELINPVLSCRIDCDVWATTGQPWPPTLLNMLRSVTHANFMQTSYIHRLNHYILQSPPGPLKPGAWTLWDQSPLLLTLHPGHHRLLLQMGRSSPTGGSKELQGGQLYQTPCHLPFRSTPADHS